MKAELQTAQLRVKPRCIIAEGSGGMIFYATPSRARALIDAGVVDLLNAAPANAPAAGPSETPSAGPGEFKEPAEKKSSAADPAGRSTDSASSSVRGTAALSSASAGDLVSPQRRSPRSPRRARRVLPASES